MSARRQRVKVGSSRPQEERPVLEELFESPREAAAQAEKETRAPERAEQSAAGTAGSGRQVPPPMPLAEIQQVPKAERRPTNFALPHALELHRRMTYYKADHDVQIQDQIALAVDTWLREQGY
ncbi:hypothetical protein [Nocardiopsis sp. FIRDI 009]|uniref:hypothetical protein n=1 Tax=Nocardiopsis sp. FIRDI 009 TaxID=714197 RepID=UPI000E22F71F|nr:hypothetical protein [Nocardiopsis sp. FIRDI 009]